MNTSTPSATTDVLSPIVCSAQYRWQDAQESDKPFLSHSKQDAKDNTQLVDGDNTVFIRLVDYDLMHGHLTYAAGRRAQASHMHGRQGW